MYKIEEAEQAAGSQERERVATLYTYIQKTLYKLRLQFPLTAI